MMGSECNAIYFSEMDSPIGRLTLTATDRGLCSIEFGGLKDQEIPLRVWAKRWLGTDQLIADREKFEQAEIELTEYFAGERNRFDLTYDLYGTEFQKKVWHALQDIPYGATASYKDVAIAIGSPKATRAVGGANNRNPLPIVIPCHRVIGAGGQMVGYGGGLNIKTFLLQLEKEAAS